MFQHFIDQITAGLNFCTPYLDDILVASNFEEEHRRHLDILFKRFESYQLAINPEKCVLRKHTVDFLGHCITAADFQPLPEKVEAISNFEMPTTVQSLRRFFGMINFYNKFIKDAALHQAPLQATVAGFNDDVAGSPSSELRKWNKSSAS